MTVARVAFVSLAAVSVLLGLVPTVSAGTSDEPEVRDAAGDLEYLGAPVPAGFEWADLQKAWFEGGEDGNIELHIETVGVDGPPPRGEIGVTFLVGSQYYISGWTVVPPLYSGGFLSPADRNGDVPAGVSPDSADATWEGNHITVMIPLRTIDPGLIGKISEPYGWSESHATQGRMYRLDETEVGTPFQWVDPAAEGPEGASPSSPPVATPSLAFAASILAVILVVAVSRTTARGAEPRRTGTKNDAR